MPTAFPAIFPSLASHLPVAAPDSTRSRRLSRVFLLSPASCSGRRAGWLLNGTGTFDLARQLAAGRSAMLGEVFSFLSGLYFRGKLAYARRFAVPPAASAVLVITPTRGLLPPDTPVGLDDLREFAGVDIAAGDPRYRVPLLRDAQRLARRLTARGEAVLLGSIATGKYLDVLAATLERRLLFPAAFVGRGDMSRGGLMLRAAAEGAELEYTAAAGAIRRGARPPRLAPPR